MLVNQKDGKSGFKVVITPSVIFDNIVTLEVICF